jgi:hypothetical protein
MKRMVLLTLVCVACWSAACGKKGDPRAPELATPKPIENLSARSDPTSITLTWTRPMEYVDGTELKDLAGFVIFRKELSASCPDCPVPYRPLTTVFVEDRERFIKQRQYRYVDEEVRPLIIYRYRVSPQLVDGALGGPSNEVEVKRGP